MSDRTPCQTSTVDLWFSDEPEDIEAAVNLCHTCPSRAACATLGAQEPFGVWGGVPDKHQAKKTGGVGRNVEQVGVNDHRHTTTGKKAEYDLRVQEGRERIQAMWQKEYPVWKIAYEMGISEDAVTKRLQAMRRQGWDVPKRQPTFGKAS